MFHVSSFLTPTLRKASYAVPRVLSMSTETIDLAVNAWSVGGVSLDSPDLVSNLFSASLIPYIAFLYFISRPSIKTPPLATFGYQFLLVFVFATIPAGIIAKSQYNDILANVDYLHLAAESLLTVTNLLIIQGFRNQRTVIDSIVKDSTITFRDVGVAVSLLVAAVGGLSSIIGHIEPVNALSLPTWVSCDY